MPTQTLPSPSRRSTARFAFFILVSVAMALLCTVAIVSFQWARRAVPSVASTQELEVLNGRVESLSRVVSDLQSGLSQRVIDLEGRAATTENRQNQYQPNSVLNDGRVTNYLDAYAHERALAENSKRTAKGVEIKPFNLGDQVASFVVPNAVWDAYPNHRIAWDDRTGEYTLFMESGGRYPIVVELRLAYLSNLTSDRTDAICDSTRYDLDARIAADHFHTDVGVKDACAVLHISKPFVGNVDSFGTPATTTVKMFSVESEIASYDSPDRTSPVRSTLIRNGVMYLDNALLVEAKGYVRGPRGDDGLTKEEKKNVTEKLDVLMKDLPPSIVWRPVCEYGACY